MLKEKIGAIIIATAKVLSIYYIAKIANIIAMLTGNGVLILLVKIALIAIAIKTFRLLDN